MAPVSGMRIGFGTEVTGAFRGAVAIRRVAPPYRRKVANSAAALGGHVQVRRALLVLTCAMSMGRG